MNGGPLDLSEALATPIDGRTTGFPPAAATTVEEVAAQGWTLDDLAPPILLLRRSAVEHNVRVMAEYRAAHGVELYPHAKTSMAPQLWARQLVAGAAGMTAATGQQVRALRAVGVRRVLLANQLVDAPTIAWLAEALGDPSFEPACWVDSVAGVDLLARGLQAAGAPRALDVLVELGHTDGRTGCRTVEDARTVAAATASSRALSLAGVAGYEGTLADDRSPASLGAVDGFLDSMRALTERLLADGAGEDGFLVTAGGSAFFDRVIERLGGGWRAGSDVRIALRCGCTITHDHGVYARSSPIAEGLRAAFEAWGPVLSRPEPGTLVVGLGRRDVPADRDPPVPLRARSGGAAVSLDGSLRVVRVMDQHTICRMDPAMALGPGDRVAFGISHPCSAFDRRRVIPMLDDDDRVVDAIVTWF